MKEEAQRWQASRGPPEAHLAAYLCVTQWMSGGWPPWGSWPPEVIWRAAAILQGIDITVPTMLGSSFDKYRHKTYTIVFTIIPTIKRSEYHLYSPIIGRIRMFVTCFFYSSACLQARGRINNMHKQANFCDNGAREVIFGSFDGRGDNEHSGASLVEISQFFAMQDDFF